ncbi:hypothetical protein ANN_12188 [Periplaneta americana]|uniref:Uncharacterized protein n=1 Tax=Periplaneta americana TaxID=6978 RepID=A0ABQ8TGV5_PERAM|nr:hypothetical protein ANN_12188 [Periplaneta americana]
MLVRHFNSWKARETGNRHSLSSTQHATWCNNTGNYVRGVHLSPEGRIVDTAGSMKAISKARNTLEEFSLARNVLRENSKIDNMDSNGRPHTGRDSRSRQKPRTSFSLESDCLRVAISSFPLEITEILNNIQVQGYRYPGEWRKFLHNAELHALYSSPDIIRNIKSRLLRWAGHVARMGESRNAYRVLVGRPEGKKTFGEAET